MRFSYPYTVLWCEHILNMPSKQIIHASKIHLERMQKGINKAGGKRICIQSRIGKDIADLHRALIATPRTGWVSYFTLKSHNDTAENYKEL